MIAYIVGGAMLLFVTGMAFQNGRAWGVLPEVMADAWHFSRRLGVLSFACTTMVSAWYLWNGEVDFPKTAGIWKIFSLVSIGSWIYFLYLEMQSIKWETLLRQTLCVMSWDDRMAGLSGEDVDKILKFLMANDDFLRVIAQVPDEERKSFLRNTSIDFQRRGSTVAGAKGKRKE